jgi:hypothetical protein
MSINPCHFFVANDKRPRLPSDASLLEPPAKRAKHAGKEEEALPVIPHELVEEIFFLAATQANIVKSFAMWQQLRMLNKQWLAYGTPFYLSGAKNYLQGALHERNFADSARHATTANNLIAKVKQVEISYSGALFKTIWRTICAQDKVEFFNRTATLLPLTSSDIELQSHLELNKLGLSTLQQEIGDFTQLQKLSISDNWLTSIPTTLSHLTNLTALKLDNNPLWEFPIEICCLTNLTALNLEYSQLHSIPESISCLTNLRTLECSVNFVLQWPEGMSCLTNLEELIFAENQITEIPLGLCSLTKLNRLALESNNLRAVPEEIGLLKNLEELYLNANELTSIPNSISVLTNLRTLVLAYNTFEELPGGMSCLTNLKELVLEGIALNTYPKWLADLPHDLSVEEYSSESSDDGNF